MRGLLYSVMAAGLCWTISLALVSASAVPGFEDLYAKVLASCSGTAGSVAACESAIIAYAGALVGAVDLAVANQSFTQLRLELRDANAGTVALQGDIDTLFEQLLPDSGALGDVGPLPRPPS